MTSPPAQVVRPRVMLALLFSINLLNFYDRQILAAVTEPIRVEFGLSDTAIGWLGTAFTLFYAAVGLPLGRLADRVSRTRFMSAGVAAWSLCTAATGMGWNYASIFIARLGVGLGEATCAPAANSLIADLYPTERRARALSWFMLGLPIGIFLSAALSGVIAKLFGWRMAFFVAAGPGLLVAYLMSRIPDPSRGPGLAVISPTAITNGATATRAWWAPYVALWRIPTLRWIVLSGALHNFNAYAVNGFLPAYLGRYHHLSLTQANLAAGITLGLVGVVALLVGGPLADRARRWKPSGRLLLGALAMALAVPCVYVAIALPSGAVLPFIALMSVGWMCFYVYYATVYATIHDVVPPALRGTAMSVYFFWMYVLGGAFGTVALGALSDRFAQRAMRLAGSTLLSDAHRATGLHDAFAIVPILGALLAVVLFAGSRTVARDIQQAVATAAP